MLCFGSHDWLPGVTSYLYLSLAVHLSVFGFLPKYNTGKKAFTNLCAVMGSNWKPTEYITNLLGSKKNFSLKMGRLSPKIIALKHLTSKKRRS